MGFFKERKGFKVNKKEELLEKMTDCIRYAVDRLTDGDLDGCPDDLRHDWVNEASELINEFYKGGVK